MANIHVDGIVVEMTPTQLTAFEADRASLSMPPTVESVSARQFKLQLLAAGLLDSVEAWVASQSRAVQIAFENSGTFVRTEPMMAAGFAAMGVTEEQIDEFFEAASVL